MAKNRELILRNISSKIQELPTLPEVVTKIIKLTADPYSKISDIVSVIEKDQSLSLKVLKMSNSAYYGLSRKIITVEHAVKILGFKVLRSLVLSASASAFFKTKDEVNREYDIYLWEHSLFSAVIARKLSSLTKYRFLADECYMAALIHDLGKKVINDYFKGFYPKLNQLMEGKENVNPLSIENQALGFDHTDVGGRIASNWLLPESLVEAIEKHHFPKLSQNHKTYTYFVYFADQISHHLEKEWSEELKEKIHQELDFSPIALKDIDLDTFVEELKEEFEQEKEIFNL